MWESLWTGNCPDRVQAPRSREIPSSNIQYEREVCSKSERQVGGHCCGWFFEHSRASVQWREFGVVSTVSDILKCGEMREPKLNNPKCLEHGDLMGLGSGSVAGGERTWVWQKILHSASMGHGTSLSIQSRANLCRLTRRSMIPETTRKTPTA